MLQWKYFPNWKPPDYSFSRGIKHFSFHEKQGWHDGLFGRGKRRFSQSLNKLRSLLQTLALILPHQSDFSDWTFAAPPRLTCAGTNDMQGPMRYRWHNINYFNNFEQYLSHVCFVAWSTLKCSVALKLHLLLYHICEDFVTSATVLKWLFFLIIVLLIWPSCTLFSLFFPRKSFSALFVPILMWSYIKLSKMHCVEALSPQHNVFKDIHLGCDFPSICDVFCSSSFINLCKHKVKYVLKVWFVQSHVAQLQRQWSVDCNVCLVEEPPGTITQLQQGKSTVQGGKIPKAGRLQNLTVSEGLHARLSCGSSAGCAPTALKVATLPQGGWAGPGSPPS